MSTALLELPEVTTTFDPLARFVAIEHERRELEAALKKLDTEAKSLEASILEDWADRSQRNASVGGLSVFVRTEMYCSKRPEVDGQQLAEALIRHGLSKAVGYNAQSLKSWIKERLVEAAGESDDDIPQGINVESVVPPDLMGLIVVGENVRLRTRLAK